MKKILQLKIIFITTLFIACKSSPESDEPVTTTTVTESISQPEPPPPPLKVSAYLIYDDSTISSFDVLNDKTIALWNTIIGADDAEKPSQNVRVDLTGYLDSIDIRIRNDKQLVVNKRNQILRNKLSYTIKNTGCDLVFVDVLKKYFAKANHILIIRYDRPGERSLYG